MMNISKPHKTSNVFDIFNNEIDSTTKSITKSEGTHLKIKKLLRKLVDYGVKIVFFTKTFDLLTADWRINEYESAAFSLATMVSSRSLKSASKVLFL